MIKKNTYQDSLRLIRLSNALASTPETDRVSVMMGTPLNKDMLAKVGMLTDQIAEVTPNDLIVTADVTSDAVGQALADTVDAFLTRDVSASSGRRIRTVRSFGGAVDAVPDANIGVISIPGEYAAEEARKLLDHHINVFLFSDNVSVDDEISLKKQARDSGLIVMGPDCGTGLISGVPLGFANTVTEGNIGVAAASGTGSQELMVQVSRLGGGISHVIGVGGRDLTEEVGGLSCEQALAALDADPATDVIVLVGKPPAPSVRSRIFDAARGLRKPIVSILIGEPADDSEHDGVWSARSLDDAAHLAVELGGTAAHRPPLLREGQRDVRGLFTGGTFAAEAAFILASGLGLPLDSSHERGYMLRAGGHEVIDLGDDAYTRGKPHPMMEPSVRSDRITRAIADPATAVVLLDVVLGYGSHDDPAGVLAPVVADALRLAAEDGREVAIIAAVCGTTHDTQDYDSQCETLRQAGITVMPSNASAARYALNIVTGKARHAAAGDQRNALAVSLLSQKPRVINIGLREFTNSLTDRHVHAIQYDWHPAAGGDKHLQGLLASLR